MRFTDPVEGNASLALRVGDTSAVGFYADHQRCEWSNYLAHFGSARSDRALAEIDSNVVGS